MSSIDAKKQAFREWLFENHSLSEYNCTDIAYKAAEIFGSYTEKITRPMQEEMSAMTKKVLEFMDCGGRGGWVSDYDIAAYIDKSPATAGARRRDLRKYGYTVRSKAIGNTHYYLLEL